jgi:hypothetical protein
VKESTSNTYQQQSIRKRHETALIIHIILSPVINILTFHAVGQRRRQKYVYVRLT